jgi:hypothetical protein
MDTIEYKETDVGTDIDIRICSEGALLVVLKRLDYKNTSVLERHAMSLISKDSIFDPSEKKSGPEYSGAINCDWYLDEDLNMRSPKYNPDYEDKTNLKDIFSIALKLRETYLTTVEKNSEEWSQIYIRSNGENFSTYFHVFANQNVSHTLSIGEIDPTKITHDYKQPVGNILDNDEVEFSHEELPEALKQAFTEFFKIRGDIKPALPEIAYVAKPDFKKVNLA